MSGSYLPSRDDSSSERDFERGARLPARHTAGDSFAGYDYYKDASYQQGGREKLEEALDLLFRRKWIVLTGFLVVLAITAIYTSRLVPQYNAASFVLVDLGGVKVDFERRSSIEGDPSDAGFSIFARNDRSLSGEIRLLQISDQLVQRVARRLQEGRGNSGGVDSMQAGTSSLGQGESLFNGWVQFVPERGSDNIIRFTGISSSAAQAALLSNLYAMEYVSLTQEASRSYISGLRKSLEEKEREEHEALTFIEAQVQRSRQAGAVSLDQEGTRLVEQIASLESQRDDARIELRVERASLNSLEREFEEINPQLAQRIASGVDRRIEVLQGQIAEEEAKLDLIFNENPELRGSGTDVLQPFTQRIQRLRAERDSLSQQFVDEVAAAGGISGSQDGLTYLAGLRRQIAEKRVRIGGIEAKLEVQNSRLAEYQVALSSLPAQSMELAQLERSRLRAEQMYQSVVEQLQEARIAEEAAPGYAQLIRQAQIPFRPVYPDPRRNLLLGAVFGLFLGLALAIVRDKLDNRIYQPDQVRQQGLKEIGVIPNMKPLIKEDYGGQAFLEHNGQQFATSLIALTNPVSSTTEAYRSVRTHIQFGLPETLVQTLMVASPSVGEGKSTTAANLAIVMAQAGRRTLLIDADLRRPQLHRMFGLARESGLIELLSNGSQFDPNAWKTYIDNLYLLTAGSPIAHEGFKSGSTTPKDALQDRRSFIVNPSELLGSEQMHHVLDSLRETFDMVIIDTPPVLAATDAALLSTQCDATVIVTRAGSTKEGELAHAIEALENVGATVIGILLNGFDITMAYGHKYRYQHYTRYGRYSKYGYFGFRDGE